MAKPDAIRPTKKQRELLDFIAQFIAEHGYSPSYREIMTGLNYTSVATVAVHVNNLIRRGHLRKRNRSARSLEVTRVAVEAYRPSEVEASETKWLIKKVEVLFAAAEKAETLKQEQLDQLYVLVGALKVLELEGAANSFIPRISELKARLAESV